MYISPEIIPGGWLGLKHQVTNYCMHTCRNMESFTDTFWPTSSLPPPLLNSFSWTCLWFGECRTVFQVLISDSCRQCMSWLHKVLIYSQIVSVLLLFNGFLFHLPSPISYSVYSLHPPPHHSSVCVSVFFSDGSLTFLSLPPPPTPTSLLPFPPLLSLPSWLVWFYQSA